MPYRNHLNERHQHILRATIQHYIATAEPVGSKTLAEEYDFSVSSATIRNVMGYLEKSGFLYQPHTSAGRIPSDSGYRVYVDQLITPNKNLQQAIEKSLTKQLKREAWTFEDILQRATQILATVSGYIALITFPQNSIQRLHHLQIIQVNSEQLMLIVVTDSYQTESILINSSSLKGNKTEIDQEWLEEELQILSNFLNHQLRGKSLNEISKLNWTELDQEFKRYGDFLKTLVQKVSKLTQLPSSTPMMIKGMSEMFRQPEFSQIEQIQMLLHLLEVEQDQLLPLIFEIPQQETLKSHQVTIRIGAENPLEQMRYCTLISAVYKQGKNPVGSVGIIGPTRMLYENAIVLVETTANYLSETLS
jgi:heat-inducible transcriptional repressor